MMPNNFKNVIMTEKALDTEILKLHGKNRNCKIGKYKSSDSVDSAMKIMLR